MPTATALITIGIVVTEVNETSNRFASFTKMPVQNESLSERNAHNAATNNQTDCILCIIRKNLQLEKCGKSKQPI